MTYEQIMEELKLLETLLGNYYINNGKRMRAAQALVTLHNAKCEAQSNYDDIVERNTEYNLREWLPSDPYDAWVEGSWTNKYYATDAWIALDGYGHIRSASTSVLVGTFIFLEDIANWLADLEEEEQHELLAELMDAVD